MWEYALLRSFDIPDIVTPQFAVDAIAHSVVENHGKADNRSIDDAVGDARNIVGTVVRLGTEGQLDALVVDDMRARPALDGILGQSGLNENTDYASAVLRQVTTWVRNNPEMPSQFFQGQINVLNQA